MNNRTRAAVVALSALVLPVLWPAHALASINTSATPADLARAIVADDGQILGAEFIALPPSGTPHAVVTQPVAALPTEGGDFMLLTNGDANFLTQPNTSGSDGANLGGGNVRGNTDLDVSILRIDLDVPAGTNCLVGLEFRFLSEEYPEWVGSSFNDAFIAELDNSSWTTNGSTITAPDNFAFDPAGNPITINAAGETSMSAAEAAGTTYDGATPLLTAATPITPGAHSLFLSIFDQGDNYLDSAVMIDNLRFGTVDDVDTDCEPGAEVVEPADEVLYGAQHGSRLVSFTRSDPGHATLVGNFIGLRSGERIVGMDQRPATGEMYALGATSATSQLYKLDLTSAALTAVGAPFTPALDTAGVGLDFDPVADRARIVSTKKDNLRVDPDTGAVTVDSALKYATGDSGAGVQPLVAGAGFTPAAAGSTTLFDIDSRRDVLVRQDPQNAGTLHTVGPLGLDVNNRVNLDIVDASDALGTLERPGGAGAELLEIDLATGAASSLGQVLLDGNKVTLYSFAVGG